MRNKTLKLSSLHEMLKQYRPDLPTASEFFARAEKRSGDESAEERLTGSLKGIDEEGNVFRVDIWFENGVQHRKKDLLCDYATLKSDVAMKSTGFKRDRFAEAF